MHADDSAQHKQRGAGKQRGELVGRHWSAEQEALHFVAVVAAQEVQLSQGFHAFGDYREVQAVGHGDDRPGNLPVLLAVGQDVDKTAVDLQHVDGKLLEVVQ